MKYTNTHEVYVTGTTHNITDLLNIVVIRELDMFMDVITINEGIPKHNALLITVGCCEEEPEEQTKIDWKEFRNIPKIPRTDQINTEEELEQTIQSLDKQIHKALIDSTVTTNKNTNTIYGESPEALKIVIKQKNKSR